MLTPKTLLLVTPLVGATAVHAGEVFLQVAQSRIIGITTHGLPRRRLRLPTNKWKPHQSTTKRAIIEPLEAELLASDYYRNR